MDKEILEKLIEGKSTDIRVRGVYLYNATNECALAFKNNPTSTNLKNWDAAREALDKFRIEIETGGMTSPGTSAPQGASLPNIPAIVKHLTALGWKVKKSSAYKALKEGKLRRQSDGTFLAADVDRYAETFLHRLDGRETDALDNLQRAKLEAEVEKTKAQATHWSLKAAAATGSLVPKELFERELAKRAAVLRNDLESFIHSESSALVNIVGGDANKIPDLIDYMTSRIENFLARYSEDKEFRLPPPPPNIENILNNEDNDDYEEGDAS